MSKKSKKARRPNVPMYTGPVTPAQTTSADGGDTQVALRPTAAPRETINADYTHVVSDLKRIGLLAGGLIAILVVLSFFIK
jgi:hypothetical protein